MARERSRYGLLVSGFGAVVLAVSVFLPWYGVSLTARGVLAIQQAGGQFASRYGNAVLQAQMSSVHAHLSSLVGVQLSSVSAHQALSNLNIVLLVLAGLAMLDALLPLARPPAGIPVGAGASVVLLGIVAAVCVAFRMIEPPDPTGGALALSLREGAWIALLGSLAMIAGGAWPRSQRQAPHSEAQLTAVWSGLSGWTPGS